MNKTAYSPFGYDKLGLLDNTLNLNCQKELTFESLSKRKKLCIERYIEILITLHS